MLAAAVNAEVFVGMLGGSYLIFATLTKTQQLPDWTSSPDTLFQLKQGDSHLVRRGEISCDNILPNIPQSYVDQKKRIKTGIAACA